MSLFSRTDRQSMRTMPVLMGPGAELIVFEGRNQPKQILASQAPPSLRSIKMDKPAMHRQGSGAADCFNRNGSLQFHNPFRQVNNQQRKGR